MQKKHYLLILVCLSLCVAPLSARAQGALQLAQVEVALWPEFDQPSMLVIYHIALSSQVTLPVQVRWRIPTIAGTPNAVAANHPDGSLYNLNYEMEEGTEWRTLVFQATTPEIQIEYYDPSLIKDGAARHFEYRWPGDHAADSFIVKVQQPLDADDVRFSPSLGAGQVIDGLVYYTSQVGPLAQGQSFSITMDYNKESNTLTSERMTVGASEPLDGNVSGHKSTTRMLLPWILGGLGVLLLGGGVYWYWRSGQEETQTRSKRGRGSRRRASAPREAQTVPESGQHVYCHQCGKRAASGDRFCRACGTQLRIN